MHLFPPTSVLVIESHPMMREALRNAIVAEADFCIAEPVFDAAQTSWMAIAAEPDTILLAYKPDIILLALGNPGGNEMGTLKALRKSLPETPILALTSSEVEGQEQAALEAGARMVLTKAAPRTELIRQLREMRTQAIMNCPAVDPEMSETKKTSIGSPLRSVPELKKDFFTELKLIQKNTDVCAYKQERKML